MELQSRMAFDVVGSVPGCGARVLRSAFGESRAPDVPRPQYSAPTQVLGRRLDLEHRTRSGRACRAVREEIAPVLGSHTPFLGLRGAIPPRRSGSLHRVSDSADLRGAGRGSATLPTHPRL